MEKKTNDINGISCSFLDSTAKACEEIGQRRESHGQLKINLCDVLSVCEGTGRFVCELDRENPECHCDSVFEHACDVSGRVQCISKLSVCDGIQDCDDNSDEEGCGKCN